MATEEEPEREKEEETGAVLVMVSLFGGAGVQGVGCESLPLL